MPRHPPALELPPGYDGVSLRTPTLPPAQHTNCYIVGHERALVVDPGSSYPAEVARLERRLYRLRGCGGNVGAVLLTHHHHDHVRGAAAIARRFEAPVAAHVETHARVELPADVARRELSGGQQLEADRGWSLALLHTPGHAPGHLCLHDPRHQALLVGDMVPGVGTTVIAPPDGEMATYLAALERLAQLAPRYLLPAHGPARRFDDGAAGAAVVRALIDHRLAREGRVLAALREGRGPLDVEAVTRAAYTDVSPLLWPLASRSTLAHLIKLVDEGRAEAVGERWQATEPTR